MKFIERDELNNLINFEEVFNKTKSAFKLFSQGKTIVPPFMVFNIPENNGSVHFKCGYVSGEKYFALKYSGAFYENEKNRLSNFLGLFLVFNSKTGEVEAIIDDKGYLTDYRTGIAGAIATITLANKNSKTVAMVGTGVQARMQIQMLMNVMQIENLQVWGRSKEKTAKYINEIKEKYPLLKIKNCETVQEAVQDADIIYTVTYSETPLVMSEWIKRGAHITAIGACEPQMQEIDEKIFDRANIVCVDSIEACEKNGELHHALEKKMIEKDKAIELGEFLNNNIKRKTTDITICDLVGIGFQDAVIADCVMNEYNRKI